MTPEILAAAREIRTDGQKGARQLALAALDALEGIAPNCPGEELRECARTLALARPMMAAVQNTVALVWSRYLATGDAQASVAEAREYLEMAPDAMAAAARRVVPTDTLITFSYSSAVVELASRLRPRHMIVPESRPNREGLKMARELKTAGVAVTLITEAQMALMIHEADAALVGADTIMPEGDLVNKIGTRLLALAARDAEVPFFSAGETLKVHAPSAPLPLPEEGDPREVCGESWLEVRNVYFEVTPASLITTYVTEEGLLQPESVGRYAEESDRRLRALMDPPEA
jgi:translation initiation factor 2B subunit (eIF-2B alpha/beta/delta family)